MSYPRNAASPPPLFATVVKAADGTAITSGVAAKYSTGAGSQAAGGGTCQHEGNGQWSYTPTQGETNVIGFGVQFYHADAVGNGPTISVVTSADVAQTGDVYALVTNATYGLDKLARTGADGDTLKTLSDQIDDVPTAAENASQVRTELATELAHLDADVSEAGGGLTAQETRDAMKLAPTAGSPAAGSVDAHLDSLLAYGAGTGTGTYTDTVTDGVDPLDNVLVQLSTDSAGANMAYRAYTGADGVFVMSPDPGTYYVWLELAGYSFTQGAQVVVT